MPILEVIPPRKILELGKTHTFTVRLRADALVAGHDESEALLSVVAEPDGCVELSAPRVTLRPDKRLEGRLSGTFTVTGKSSEGNALVEVTVPRLTSAWLEVDVTEPAEELPPLAPVTFQFERGSYRVPAGKRKRILLLAPTAAVNRHGNRVALHIPNTQGVLVRQTALELLPSADGDWYQATVEVEGRQHGAVATLSAQCGSGPLKAETVISVRPDETGPAPPVIKIAALNSFVPGTFETDDTGLVKITVNATHPAARRYFGPQPDFPRQNSLPARLMVAEIVADLTVLDVLRRQLRQQPVPVEQMYRRRFQMLADLLPLCHESQVADPDAELREGTLTSTPKS